MEQEEIEEIVPFKARKMPNYKFPDIKKSTVPLTEPEEFNLSKPKVQRS